MPLQTVKDISSRAFGATRDASVSAAKGIADVTETGLRATFNALGAGCVYTLDGIEYVDDRIDSADLALERAAGAAGRSTASIFGEQAKPHGERAGRIIYKAAKIALNFIQIPGMYRESIDLLRALRR